MKVGITGSTGGLGRGLTEFLINKGFTVKILVRKESNIEKLTKLNVEICYGDICDYDSLIYFVKEINVCFHIAAQVTHTTREQYYRVNVNGTKNVCNAILEYNSDCQLIYCSSIVTLRVKSLNKFLFTDYTMSKYYAEKMVNNYINNEGLKATIIYPGLIYGPFDLNFVPNVVKFIKKGKIFYVTGGEKGAPLIYIDDLCELFFLAAINPVSLGKKYISVKGLDIGIHDFIKMIAKKTNYPVPTKKYPKTPLLLAAILLGKVYRLFKLNSLPPINKRVVDIMSIHFNNDFTEATVDLGWKQKTSVEHGLDKAFNWYKAEGIM